METTLQVLTDILTLFRLTEQWQQIRFGIGCRHAFHGLIQFNQRLQNQLFGGIHGPAEE